MGRLRHLLLTSLEDRYDSLCWSGTSFALRESLARQVEKLTALGPLKPKRTPHHAALRVLVGSNPPRYPLWMTPPALKHFAYGVGRHFTAQPRRRLSISSQLCTSSRPGTRSWQCLWMRRGLPGNGRTANTRASRLADARLPDAKPWLLASATLSCLVPAGPLTRRNSLGSSNERRRALRACPLARYEPFAAAFSLGKTGSANVVRGTSHQF